MPGTKEVRVTETKRPVELSKNTHNRWLQKKHVCPACGKALYSYEDYKRHYSESHLPKDSR